MRTMLYYDTVKVAGPQKKIVEFNEAGGFMDQKELKIFDKLCLVLADKDKYFNTKIEYDHLDLMNKLLEVPVDKLFPCLDLYRIFLLHPDASNHYKKFEDGANHLY